MSSKSPSLIGQIPHHEITITKDNADLCARKFIEDVLQTFMAHTPDLERIDFNGGLTNTLIGYRVTTTTEQDPNINQSDIFLVKIYGAQTELIIDRMQELRGYLELARNNIAPPIYCTFSNGFCYKFIKGTACTPTLFRDDNIIKLSALCLARLHSVKLSDEYLKSHAMEGSVFSFIRLYLSHLTEEVFPTSNGVVVPSKTLLVGEVYHMDQVVASLKNKAVVFCHNDLNLPNLIYDDDDEDSVLHCIDFEYAGPNYAGYDIANHFCEFAGNDENIDFSLFPDEKKQRWWLKIYLEKVAEITTGCCACVSEDEVEELYVQVSCFSLVSHLLWGIWALVQGTLSQIDFDYVEYAVKRLDEYFKWKDGVMKTITNSSFFKKQQK